MDFVKSALWAGLVGLGSWVQQSCALGGEIGETSPLADMLVVGVSYCVTVQDSNLFSTCAGLVSRNGAIAALRGACVVGPFGNVLQGQGASRCSSDWPGGGEVSLIP